MALTDELDFCYVYLMAYNGEAGGFFWNQMFRAVLDEGNVHVASKGN